MTNNKTVKAVQPKSKKAVKSRKAKVDTRARGVEYDKRILIITDLLLEGAPVPQIVLQVQTDWKLSQPQAYRYAKDATARIREKLDANLDGYIGMHYRRLEHLYSLAMKAKQYDAALRALKQISDLVGMDAPKRVDLGLPGAKVETHANGDIEAGVDALLRIKQMQAVQSARHANAVEGEVVNGQSA